MANSFPSTQSIFYPLGLSSLQALQHLAKTKVSKSVDKVVFGLVLEVVERSKFY